MIFWIAATESPPPITHLAFPLEIYLAIASVPCAKLGASVKPNGPFHTIVFAPSRSIAKCSNVFSPTSKICHPVKPSAYPSSTSFSL